MIKTLLLFFLSFNLYSQTYEFNEVWKRESVDWELTQKSGQVIISLINQTITITTKEHTQILHIDGITELYRDRNLIYSCVDENGLVIVLRFFKAIPNDINPEMYYYSNVKDKKYLKFCLKKVIN